MRNLTLLLLCLACFNSHSQNEGNNWYFGINAGITFNTNPPSGLTESQIYTDEGCTAISDVNGELLFYSDGVTVWNSQNEIMPNGEGLHGDFSSTQSGLIIKKPGNNSIYTLFCMGAENSINSGLSYSEIDMSLNGGLGDVTEVKNELVYSNSGEKLMAVRHSNGVDFWVVIRDNLVDTETIESLGFFRCYLFSQNGLSTTPVISEVESPPITPYGYLKSNLAGDMVASANAFDDTIELYKFDNETGEFLDPILLDNVLLAYGLEFSPNGQLLYVTKTFSGPNFSSVPNFLVQYDVSTFDAQAISDSETIIHQESDFSYGLGALQTGPDEKIYVVKALQSSLSVINNPNLAGEDCNFVNDQIILPIGQGVIGLPMYHNSYYVPIDNGFIYENNCLGDTTVFSTINQNVDEASWNFDDINSGSENMSNLINPTHVFTASGDYEVILISSEDGLIDTTIVSVTIYEYPDIEFSSEWIACEGDELSIFADQDFDSYLWEEGSQDEELTVYESGWYTLEASINGCWEIDSTYVEFIDYPNVDLGPDTTICSGTGFLLNASNPGATYLWQDESNLATLAPVESGVYSVVVNASECSVEDSVSINVIDCETILTMPNVFSPNIDAMNSNFIPIEIANTTDEGLKIYNRWGGLVFETNDLGRGWDGMSENKEPCSDGVYFWIISYKDLYSNTNSKNGTVTLLR